MGAGLCAMSSTERIITKTSRSFTCPGQLAMTFHPELTRTFSNMTRRSKTVAIRSRDSRRSGNLPVQQLTEVSGDRTVNSGCSAAPPSDRRPRCDSRLPATPFPAPDQGGQRRTDAGVVADFTDRQRHVQILANRHACWSDPVHSCAERHALPSQFGCAVVAGRACNVQPQGSARCRLLVTHQLGHIWHRCAGPFVVKPDQQLHQIDRCR